MAVQLDRRLENPPGIQRSRRLASAINERTSSSVICLMSTLRRFAAMPQRIRRLRGEWNGPRSRKSEAEASEHRQVGVKPDALNATDAQEREAVFVLQASELALD